MDLKDSDLIAPRRWLSESSISGDRISWYFVPGRKNLREVYADDANTGRRPG